MSAALEGMRGVKRDYVATLGELGRLAEENDFGDSFESEALRRGWMLYARSKVLEVVSGRLKAGVRGVYVPDIPEVNMVALVGNRKPISAEVKNVLSSFQSSLPQNRFFRAMVMSIDPEAPKINYQAIEPGFILAEAVNLPT